MTAGAHDDRAATGVIRPSDRLSAADNPARWKVRPWDDGHQLINRYVRIVEHRNQGIANLAQIVRRDRGRHADGNAVGAVDQQIREAAGENHRFGPTFVVSRDEGDRVELQVVQHHRRKGAQAGFRVPHGSRRQAGNRTEVTLLVDQDMPHVPFLGHPDKSRVDDTLPVRVVITAGVTRNLRALDPSRTGAEVEVVHRDQNATLRRLQTIANVRQGAGDDHAHRIRQVTVFQFLLDRQFDDPTLHIDFTA